MRKIAILAAAAAIISMPSHAQDRRVVDLRKDGTLIPYVTWPSRPSENLRVQTTIRPYSGNRGFVVQGKFDNGRKLTGHHLCSVTYFRDAKGHVVAYKGIRQLVDPTWGFSTQVVNRSTRVNLTPDLVKEIVSAELTHLRCERNKDFRELVDFAAEAVKKYNDASQSGQSGPTGG